MKINRLQNKSNEGKQTTNMTHEDKQTTKHDA